MIRAVAMLAFACVALAAGGCCKSLQCAAFRTAERQLGCKKVSLTEVTDQLHREGRDLPADRRIQRAEGCGRVVELECALVTSGVLHRASDPTNAPIASEQTQERPGDVPREMADPQWRCWVLPERVRPAEGGAP